jgi:hypothetical protein
MASRQRDLFPLPLGPCVRHHDFVSKSFEPRSVSRKVLRRQQVYVVRANAVTDCCRALNELEGGLSSAGPSRGSDLGCPILTAGQTKVVTHVTRSVSRMGKPPVGMDPAGAFAELRGASVYEDPEATLVSFDPGLISLPEVGNKAVPLADLYGEGGPQFVSDFISSQVVSNVLASKHLGAAGISKCYIDPVLGRSGPSYLGFVRSLFDRGMVDYDVSVVESVGFFLRAQKER